MTAMTAPKVVQKDPTYLVFWKPPGLKIKRQDKAEPPGAKELLEIQFKEVFFPVSALEKDTAGLVLFARDALSAKNLTHSFKAGKIELYFHALVWGTPTAAKGMFRAYLKDPKAPLNAEPAQTEFEWLRTDSTGRSWIKLRALTNRVRQIRRHLLGAGLPVVGDKVFGDETRDSEYFDSQSTEPCMQLFGLDILFPHPSADRKVVIQCDISGKKLG